MKTNHDMRISKLEKTMQEFESCTKSNAIASKIVVESSNAKEIRAMEMKYEKDLKTLSASIENESLMLKSMN